MADPRIISRENAWVRRSSHCWKAAWTNGISDATVKMFKNALWTTLRTIFWPKMHCIAEFCIHDLKIYPGLITPEPLQKRLSCLDLDTTNFCFARQRSHCSCFIKRLQGRTPQVSWGLVVQTQLIHITSSRTLLPVGTAWKSVEWRIEPCSLRAEQQCQSICYHPIVVVTTNCCWADRRPVEHGALWFCRVAVQTIAFDAVFQVMFAMMTCLCWKSWQSSPCCTPAPDV